MQMISTHDVTGARTARHALFWAVVIIPISLLPLIYGRVSPVFYTPLAVVLDLFFLGCAYAFFLKPEKATARRLFFSSIIWLPLILTLLVITSL
jgi:heme O synthase-like polyprenyltransferase